MSKRGYLLLLQKRHLLCLCLHLGQLVVVTLIDNSIKTEPVVLDLSIILVFVHVKVLCGVYVKIWDLKHFLYQLEVASELKNLIWLSQASLDLVESLLLIEGIKSSEPLIIDVLEISFSTQRDVALPARNHTLEKRLQLACYFVHLFR